jgi:hypothetical protein
MLIFASHFYHRLENEDRFNEPRAILCSNSLVSNLKGKKETPRVILISRLSWNSVFMPCRIFKWLTCGAWNYISQSARECRGKMQSPLSYTLHSLNYKNIVNIEFFKIKLILVSSETRVISAGTATGWRTRIRFWVGVQFPLLIDSDRT